MVPWSLVIPAVGRPLLGRPGAGGGSLVHSGSGLMLMGMGWRGVAAASFQDLHKKYSYIRKTRPDGNCFYRAFGFSHLEALLDDSKELQR